MRQLAAEFAGTFALVFAGTGAIIINDISGGTITHVGVALTFGLIVSAMIYTVGDVSGAHLNPAVTLAFSIAGRFKAARVLPYAGSQLAGAFAASLLLRALFESHATLGATLPAASAMQSAVLEFMLTLLLMFTILGVSHGASEKGLFAGAAIGGVVALEALFAGPISGASMNPARSLAPAIDCKYTHRAFVDLHCRAGGGRNGGCAAFGIHSRARNRGPHIGAAWMSPLLETVMDKVRVLFLCTGNSARSQMAEALLRHLGGDNFEAHSAGLDPKGMNPLTVEALAEIGLDTKGQSSKSLQDYFGKEFAHVITVCDHAHEKCPAWPGKAKRHHWSFEDPAALKGAHEEQLTAFRKIRDQIADRIKLWLQELERALPRSA